MFLFLNDEDRWLITVLFKVEQVIRGTSESCGMWRTVKGLFQGAASSTVASCSLRLNAASCVSMNGNCAGVKWEVTTFPSGHFQLWGAEQSEDVEKEARASRFSPFLPFLHISQRISVVFLPFGPPAHNQSAMLQRQVWDRVFFFFF